MNRIRMILRILSLSLFVLVILQFLNSQINLLLDPIPSQDFEVFYLSGREITRGGDPYATLAQSPFRNPPPTLLLFVPLSFFSILTSQIIWFIASIIFFILGSYFLFQALGIPEKLGRNLFLLWFPYLSLSFLFFPLRYDFGSGQINCFLFFLISLTFYLYVKNKNISVLPLTISIIFKITPLFLVLQYLFTRRFKDLQWLTILLIGFNLLTFGIFGSKVYYQYFSAPTYFEFGVVTPLSQSLSSTLSRVGLSLLTVKLVEYLGISIAALFLWRLSLKKSLYNIYLAWSMSIIFVLLFSPFAWKYHFTIIIFSFVTTLYMGLKLKLNKLFYLLIFVAYLAIAGNIKDVPGDGLVKQVILSHVTFGTILLLLLNFYILKKSQK